MLVCASSYILLILNSNSNLEKLLGIKFELANFGCYAAIHGIRDRTEIGYFLRVMMSDYLFWEHFEDNVIRDVANSFMEFSAKLSNSNVKGGVSVGRYVDLPYLAVSTVAPGMITPKSTMPANYAKAVKQLLAVKGGGVDVYGMETSEISDRIQYLVSIEESESGKLSAARKAKIVSAVLAEFPKIDVPAEEISRFCEIINSANGSSKNAVSLDQRLKQLLVFDPDLNADVSVTPLRSSELPELVVGAEMHRAALLGSLSDEEYMQFRYMKQPAVDKELKEKKVLTGIEATLFRSLFSRIDFPIGGANPQNIGIGKGSAIRSPLLTPLRSVNKEINDVFAIHYKGIKPVSYKLSADLLADLHQKQSAGIEVDMHFKNMLTTHARKLVSDMNHRAQIALEQLRDAAEDVAGKAWAECTDEELLDESLLNDEIQAGILLTSRRDNSWRKAYADCLITYLMGIKFRPKGESSLIKSTFSDVEAAIIRSVVEKESV